ncbi:Transketolase [Dyadobacter sp. SG02]|nr:Transketolase [Dyadobacter sp. SG02]
MALLLAIKDSDIRLLSLYQCRHAVDNAIHIGGAFSATIPMVSLFYGGIIDVNVEQPAATGQDMFVLSKGHAVATLASIYHDLGYFGHEILENSRSLSSLLNGHPGPLLPGVHVATGPMGQGMGVAQGFAIAGQRTRGFDVYAVTGDGELQEGPIWETVMYAGFKKLDNLCVMVDHNGGQLDNVNSLHFPYHNLAASFESFGWRVLEVDATQYETMHHALLEFKYGERDGRPTVIICRSTKGHGGFSDFMNNHKVNIAGDLLDQEEALQQAGRERREAAFFQFLDRLNAEKNTREIADALLRHAREMGFELNLNTKSATRRADGTVRTQKAPVRDKRIQYESNALPKLEKGKQYGANKVIESVMKVLARDERIVSIDSDLASTSGLQAGVGYVDKTRALNVGVAEANMMLIGEAFAVLGANAWISTFCPFFDWKVLRRIAVGHQERLEVIAANGWLSEGHGIDLTLVATAADLETQSNGATHMGNDDALMLAEAAYVQIINVSCPQQLFSIIRWIAEGNRGIIYLRVLRAPSEVIYPVDFQFEPGKSYAVRNFASPDACIVSSGRGVYEALAASEMLEKAGRHVNVIDMPSTDSAAIVALHRSGTPVFIAEQNNGYLWAQFRKVLFETETEIDTRLLVPVNTAKGGLHYIHSGTYAELAAHYGLDAAGLADTILKTINGN